MSFSGKRYWLVGASEGLGLALAQQMHSAGASLILSARSAERLDAACAILSGAIAVPLDVSDSAAVTAAAFRSVAGLGAEIAAAFAALFIAPCVCPAPRHSRG